MTAYEEEEAYLRKLYEMINADEPGHENIYEIGEKLGFDHSLTEDITRRLEEKGLVTGLSVAGTIDITPEGELKARGVDVEKAMWEFLRQLDVFTESNNPRKENKWAIGESLGYDRVLVEVITRDLFERNYVILFMSYGIRITEEGIIKARSLE